MRTNKVFPIMLVLTLVATMVVAVPMSAQAVTVDEPDDIPGVDPGQATYQSTVGGAGDPADVYTVDVMEYDTLFVGVSAPAATDFDVYLFEPAASNITTWAPEEDTTSFADYPRAFSYQVQPGDGGTYHVAVKANSGSGPYTLTMWVMSSMRASKETTENYAPRVDGDIVTWWDWDSNSASHTVLVHDLDTSVTMTLGPGAAGGYQYPDVSGNTVVIHDRTGGDRVVKYDVGSMEETYWASPSPVNSISRPRIHGDTVTWEWNSSSGAQNQGIYYRQGTDTPGTWGYGNAGGETQPSVSGDRIAYTVPWYVGAASDEHNLDVFDISKGTSVTVASTIRGNYFPSLDIGGDVVAWMDHQTAGLNNEDIHAYDFSTDTEFVVCDDAGGQRFPAVSDCWIVWQDDNAFWPDTSIRGYHIPSGITYDLRDVGGVYEGVPDVGGGTLAWQDDRLGDTSVESQDIYAGYLPPDETGPTTLMTTTEQAGKTKVELEAYDDPFGCGVWYTQYKLDDGHWQTYTGPFWIDQAGEHEIVYKSKDYAHQYGTYVYDTVTVNAADTVDYTSLAGDDRFETAVEISQESYPGGAGTVLVATAANWPDALGGAALAGAVDGPIMLVEKDSIPEAVADEIERLGATDAIILGGTAVISNAVWDALEDMGLRPARLGGADRFATARLIADVTIHELGAAYDGRAFVATGDNFPDALAAAPIAANQGWPIFLLDPEGDTPATMDGLGVTDAFILGGTAVVSNAQETALTGALGGDVERLAGNDRYETAVTVAQYGVDNAGLFWDGVTIATGENFPDALSGGVLPATNDTVMVLTRTDSLPAPVHKALSDNKTVIDEVFYLGGNSAISQAVRAAVAAALK